MKTNQKKSQIKIQWMIRKDMEDVLKIEAASFEFPWIENDFIRELRPRNTVGLTCFLEEEIVGYCIYRLKRNHLDIVNLAVHPNFRYQEIGTQLIKKLYGKLSKERRRYITIEIRESNLGGLAFLKSLGFICTAQIPNYYELCEDDCYLLKLDWHPEKFVLEDFPLKEEIGEYCEV